MDELLSEFEKHRENSLYISVMDMILHANKALFEEVKGVYGFIQELFEDELKEGKEAAWSKAWEKAEESFAVLIQKLVTDSRTEDLMRATNDQKYRKKLYKEYGIETSVKATDYPE